MIITAWAMAPFGSLANCIRLIRGMENGSVAPQQCQLALNGNRHPILLLGRARHGNGNTHVYQQFYAGQANPQRLTISAVIVAMPNVCSQGIQRIRLYQPGPFVGAVGVGGAQGRRWEGSRRYNRLLHRTKKGCQHRAGMGKFGEIVQ